jgi:hypothetical protein
MGMTGDGTYKARGDDACHRVQMSVKLGSPLTSYPCQTNISDENFDETAMRLMELKKFSMDLKRAVILVTRETRNRDVREGKGWWVRVYKPGIRKWKPSRLPV